MRMRVQTETRWPGLLRCCNVQVNYAIQHKIQLQTDSTRELSAGFVVGSELLARSLTKLARSSNDIPSSTNSHTFLEERERSLRI